VKGKDKDKDKEVERVKAVVKAKDRELVRAKEVARGKEMVKELAQVSAAALPIRVQDKAAAVQLDKMAIINKVTRMHRLYMNRFMHQNALEMVAI
jgi:K+-transporting ATPase c subunit